MKSVTYMSDYGNTYLLLPPTTGSNVPLDAKTKVEVTCTVNQCMINQYVTDEECIQCPPNTRAPQGSVSLSSCIRCPGGTYLAHPLSSDCALSTEFSQMFISKGWRVWSNDFHLDYWGEWWKINELEFYSTLGCEDGTKIDTSTGTPIASGAYNDSYGASKAFGGGSWLGKPDEDNFTWVGMMFTSDTNVRCVKVFAGDNYKSTELRVQAYNEGTDYWENAWIETNLDQSDNAVHTVTLQYGTENPTASAAPSDSPSLVPSVEPSLSQIPSDEPSLLPTSQPSLSMVPSLEPSLAPSSEPSVSAVPSLLVSFFHQTHCATLLRTFTCHR
jgi:hypothetical protein